MPYDLATDHNITKAFIPIEIFTSFFIFFLTDNLFKQFIKIYLKRFYV